MKSINTLRISLLALSLITHQATAAVINIAGTGQTYDNLGEAVAAGDFNCDGYDDLVAGVPDESGGGAINIVYGGTGSGAQLGATGNTQLVLGGFMAAASGDGFGYSLAAGDFNGDGCADIAAGMPYKDVGSVMDAGMVLVMYGHWRGASQGGFQSWHQNSAGVPGGPELFDYFGYSLAVGDFNGDSYGDLAIGVAGENDDAGWVYVMHGQSSGLTTVASLFFSQDSAGIAGEEEPGDRFGESLVSGDFNNDGYDDLAVGSPSEEVNGALYAGVVHTLYGSAGSLSGSGSQMWRQGAGGVLDDLGDRNFFGSSLAAGDFDNDGKDDLAIGVPGERWSSGPFPPGDDHCGAVNVLYGENTGLSAARDQIWHPDVAPIAVGCNGFFGNALVAADFNGDNRDDLAIGAPYAYVNNVGTGFVQLLYGAISTGLTTSGTQGLHQNVGDVEGVNEWDNHFGWSLAAGDFNADGRADLVVGAPGEIVSGVEAGGAQVFYGAAGALNRADDQLFVQ